MDRPKTINEVISTLDEIIEDCLKQSSPLGFFAALYQKVTIRVKEGIEAGRFEDGPRMEKLDVVFANRYIDAYRQYTSGQQPTTSWKITFDAAHRSDLILLQHLLLGMNAHINLDLGIAAAELNPGVSIEALKNDFLEINTLLIELVEQVQKNISNVSPFFALIDWLAKGKDEQFAKFSMKAARKHAWLVAQRLAFVEDQNRVEAITGVDAYVQELGDVILKPGRLIAFVKRIVLLAESKDIGKNIQALRVVNE